MHSSSESEEGERHESSASSHPTARPVRTASETVESAESAGPSSHPTAKPEADFALLAEAGRDFGLPPIIKARPFAIEMAVPVRANRCSSPNIGHRAAFVLMHVDGITAII
jgi:hypothetical protein